MTFKAWILKNYLNKDSHIGDLAGDIDRDKNFPDTKSYGRILNYLKTKFACKECIATFKEAYRNYYHQNKDKELDKNVRSI